MQAGKNPSCRKGRRLHAGRFMSAVRPPRWPGVDFTAALLLIVLLPWWRNHGYRCDLSDYGLGIADNGYLNPGELPYVNFTPPMQVSFLGLSWMFERVGDGTYAGLAIGGAARIVSAAVTLPLMLARRWPCWAAAIAGLAVRQE